MTSQKPSDTLDDAPTRNPYLTGLDERVDVILELDPGEYRYESKMAHLAPDNDWKYPRLAGMALTLAHGWASPLSRHCRSRAAWNHMETILSKVLNDGAEGKWWREETGTGDDNINRFTLLPLMELFLRVGKQLTPDFRRRCLDVIEKAIDEQIDSYHRRENRHRGRYPNMDAYFMLIMEEAGRILARGSCFSLAVEYLNYLEVCLFDGGGFMYSRDKNECEPYHRIVVMILVRFWELTRSRKVLDILEKTLPYYPNAVEPSGVAEGFTDPFHKHYWHPADPCPLDVLATLFPDAPEAGAHRFVANQLHALRKDNDQNSGMFAVWAADYWRSEKGTPPPDELIRHDASVRGPRGRIGTFSWAATTGACVDTFVGAMAAESPEKLSSVQAVGAEVVLNRSVGWKDPNSPLKGRRFDRALYVSDREYRSRLIITKDWACVGVGSFLFPGMIHCDDSVPHGGWETRQAWFLGRDRLVGLVAIEVGTDNAERIQAARVYVRLGGNARDVVERDGVHRRGDLSVRLVQHNFAQCSVEPGYAFYLDAEPTSSEIILSSPPTADPSEPFMALIEISPQWSKPADVTSSFSKNILGFSLRDGEAEIRLALNLTNQNVSVPGFEMAGNRTRFRSFGGPPVSNPRGGQLDDAVAPGELTIIRNS